MLYEGTVPCPVCNVYVVCICCGVCTIQLSMFAAHHLTFLHLAAELQSAVAAGESGERCIDQ